MDQIISRKQTDRMSEIIGPSKEYENMNIISVGTIPPSPTELLFEKTFREIN